MANDEILDNLESCIVKDDGCQKVLEYAQNACESGKNWGCFVSADMLGRGLGGTKDAIESFELFKKSCENGVAQSCYEVSVKYLNGEGVPQSFELSGKTLNKACELGSNRACEILKLLP